MAASEEVRFDLLQGADIEDFIASTDSSNTKKVIKFGLVVFREFCKVANVTYEELSNQDLDSVLARFYIAAKNKRGEDYSAKSMSSIRFGLQRHFIATKDVDILKSGSMCTRIPQDCTDYWDDWLVQVATDSEVSGNCPLVDSMSCGTTTLENGEVYAMVPKVMTDEKIYLPYLSELENTVTDRLICATPACISIPCLNGGTCLETVHGFDCICTPEFYDPTCDTERCAGPWHFFEGSCYEVFPEEVTFDQALMNCRDIDVEIGQVDLASVHNDQELEFILDLCQGLDKTGHWIGLHRHEEVEGAFVWSDGTPFHYTSWYPGEPNDLGNNEDCVEINQEFKAIRNVSLWNDVPCSITNRYICKVTFNV